jgi:hypothetical protein
MKGKGKMANIFVSAVVSLVIGIILVANVFMPTFHNANTTGWTSSETSLWNVLGIAVIIGLVVGAFSMFGLI